MFVEVEQHAAAGGAHQFGEEFRFAEARGGELQIGGRILDQEPAAEHGLGAVDVGDDDPEGLLGVGQREQVRQGQKTIAGGGEAPGQVIGHQARADAALQGH